MFAASLSHHTLEYRKVCRVDRVERFKGGKSAYISEEFVADVVEEDGDGEQLHHVQQHHEQPERDGRLLDPPGKLQRQT